MSDSLGQLNQYIDVAFRYGPFWVYAAIFVACFIENLFPPFPGDSFILAAGGLVGAGRLALVPALLCVVCGGMCSVAILYVLGRRYGREFFIKRNYKFFSAADVAKTEEKLRRYGWLILSFSRFVAGVRSVIALVAGIARYSPVKMVMYTTLSYLIFTGLLMFVAIQLVSHFDTVDQIYRAYNRVVWVVVVVVVIAFVLHRMSRLRKRT